MATKKKKAKEKLLGRLTKAQQDDLVKRLSAGPYSNFKCGILLLVLYQKDILLSFICGFIANLPISVLFNILTIDVMKFSALWLEILYFIIYGLCLISTAMLTWVSFQFTIKYTKINSVNKGIVANTILYCIEEEDDNGEKRKPPISFLSQKLKMFIFFGICSVVFVIGLFVLNFWLG